MSNTSFRDFFKKRIDAGLPLILDGGMGTMIQAALADLATQGSALPAYSTPDELNVKQPDIIKAIHRAYLEAGSDILTTNTFGATPIKMKRSGVKAVDAVKAGVQIAREACSELAPGLESPRFVAFDIGPTGKLLEPLGDLSFDEAYDNFAEVARAAESAGADLVIIETMSDLYELKAAALAVKGNTSLPFFASATFQQNLRTLTGADAETAATYLEALRPLALGWNCGGSLEDAKKLVAEFCRCSRFPVLAQPNAGLPHIIEGKTVYKVEAAEFAAAQVEHYRLGALVLGGCCGTTPAHIQAMKEALEKEAAAHRPSAPLPAPATRICSGALSVEIGGANGPVIIGERINPTGKKRFKEALLAGDASDYIMDEAEAQIDAGAQILDLNVGVPGLDEAAVMEESVLMLQETIKTPLQIDSSDAKVLEAAMRRYNGKPLVNSVNGKRAVMDVVFPLVAKYGGAVVALCLDDGGIPPTAEGRLAIADTLIKEAARYDIPPNDIVIDTLTLSASAPPEGGTALETVRAIALIKAKYGAQGIKTGLGVSNVSFGLPKREAINSAFFAMALSAGLDACIINPLSREMMQVWRSYRALAGLDAHCSAYIEAASTEVKAAAPQAASVSGLETKAPALAAPQESSLQDIIIKGYKERAAEAARELLQATAPLDIINNHIVPALNVVGSEYESGRFFLPQLLMSANAVQAAFEEIKAAMAASGKPHESRGTVALATVHGDIHDIGKNIVKALLENYGFEVLDLGKNVAPETIVETVLSKDVKLLGLSALMTTTVANMEKTIALLRDAQLERGHIEQGKFCIVMAGGAVLTEDYAKRIGADYYVKDALASVAVAQRVFSSGGAAA
jgi:5-methyltetrahydrofolate--homocysteine methyltransferase